MIRKRQAKLIRIGIMARCLPYTVNKDPDPIFGGYSTHLDFYRLRTYQYDWFSFSGNSLTQKAFQRTAPWISTRYR